jgi:hypothetical protein
MRVSFRDGDLLHNIHTSEQLIVQGETFTKRFMEAQDYEMEAHGMGEFAGIYGSALRAVSPKTGQVRVLRISMGFHRTWRNLTAESEEASAERSEMPWSSTCN